MKKNTKLFIGGGLIFTAILTLLIISTPAASRTELTISDVNKNPIEYKERYILTQGLLIEDSVEWDAEKIELNFKIRDEEGNELSVYHHGVRPDNFTQDIIVIVEGFMQENGVFNAEKVQTKCPSKYEGEDPKKYDKEFHEKLKLDSKE